MRSISEGSGIGSDGGGRTTASSSVTRLSMNWAFARARETFVTLSIITELSFRSSTRVSREVFVV